MRNLFLRACIQIALLVTQEISNVIVCMCSTTDSPGSELKLMMMTREVTHR